MEGRLACLAFAFLVLLAVLLWEPEPCGCHGVAWAAPDLDALHVAAEQPALAPPKSRLPTYDRGRTTIPPKITDAALARLRGA